MKPSQSFQLWVMVGLAYRSAGIGSRSARTDGARLQEEYQMVWTGVAETDVKIDCIN
jgi:hypothetical protein